MFTAEKCKIVLGVTFYCYQCRDYNLDLSERLFVVLKRLSTEIFIYPLSKTYPPPHHSKKPQQISPTIKEVSDMFAYLVQQI